MDVLKVAFSIILVVLALGAPASAKTSDSLQISGVVSYVRTLPDRAYSPRFVVENQTNAVVFCFATNAPNYTPVFRGAHVHITGHALPGYNGIPDNHVTNCRILGHQTPPRPAIANIQQLLRGQFDCRLSQFSGTLRDVATSETAPSWVILVICDLGNSIFVSVPANGNTKRRLSEFLGLRVGVRGVCVPFDLSNRLACGRTFKIASEYDVKPIDGQQVSVSSPDISTIRAASPAEILSLGRHSAEGRVLAVWGETHALLQTPAKQIVGVELQGGVPPVFDECVRVVGLPESDLFRINLIHATWSHVDNPRQSIQTAREATPRHVMPHREGYNLVNSGYHGKAITLSGVVRSISNDRTHRFYLDCDNMLVPVDFRVSPKTATDLSVGCSVCVSGTCIIQQEERHGLSAFPRLKDFFLVLRTPDDLKILSRPSWWTPTRLLGVIGTLLLALGGVFIWNRSLVRIADRRSRELLKEQLARVESELKVGERTRLSVELHDTLSQNLVGAAMEINTVEQMIEGDDALNHLRIASKTIKSSRDELRNCLWDLRSQALEEPDMNAAIRKTLEPYVSDVDLQIRFNVPRETFTDNTAHALMRIIRELVLNAIRHGHARTVKIAGSRENGELLFSVRDDGCGFDPAAAPGIGQGHFGLQGIHERLRLLKGTVNIESASGAGTYVSARFQIPDGEAKKI